jgi:UDPglucose 6-dehydrogenase
MRELYEPFNRNHDRTMFMDVRSAELTKYAANAMLATKISFMNELANMAEPRRRHRGSAQGHRRRPAHRLPLHLPRLRLRRLCFPKDVQALGRTADQIGYDAPLLKAVEAVNNRQKTTLFAKLARHFGGAEALPARPSPSGAWPSSPTPTTCARPPAARLIEALWQAGARVQAYDPVAMRASW